MLLGAQIGTGDAFGAVQIDHLTKLTQIVELTFPVATNSEDVDVVTTDIVNLLTFVLLDNNLIGQTGGTNSLYAFHERLFHINLATGIVETIGSDAYYQIVAKGFSTFQQFDMTIVEVVIGNFAPKYNQL